MPTHPNQQAWYEECCFYGAILENPDSADLPHFALSDKGDGVSHTNILANFHDVRRDLLHEMAEVFCLWTSSQYEKEIDGVTRFVGIETAGIFFAEMLGAKFGIKVSHARRSGTYLDVFPKIQEGDKVILVEDVVTTFATSRLGFHSLRCPKNSRGDFHIMPIVFSLANRSREDVFDTGLPNPETATLYSLFEIDAQMWCKDESCDLCKLGSPVSENPREDWPDLQVQFAQKNAAA